MSTYSESFRFISTRRPIKRSKVSISSLTSGPSEIHDLENLESNIVEDRIKNLCKEEVAHFSSQEKKT